MKILHIAPHLGGGVGQFCNNIFRLDKNNEHFFLLLENPIDMHHLANFNWTTIEKLNGSVQDFVSEYDIVQIEFWNHPLLFQFLTQNEMPPCRLIIYAHVSGLYSPNIIPEFIFQYADQVVLSTPASVKNYINHINLKKCQVIHELGGCKRSCNVVRRLSNYFTISYIGTASASKIHSDYISACKKILCKIPNTRFIVASNDDNTHLQAEARQVGILDSFVFLTRISDISSILSQSNVFGYPLRRDHFGTGEQALLEAMGSGAPPVVLNNPAEISLIADGKTGFIAHNINQYVDIIEYCFNNPEFVEYVGNNAKSFALEQFSEAKTLEKFQTLYDNIRQIKRTFHPFNYFKSVSGQSLGWEFFKSYLGGHCDIENYEASNSSLSMNYYRHKIKQDEILMSTNKGGLKMYKKYFSDDIVINDILNYA